MAKTFPVNSTAKLATEREFATGFAAWRRAGIAALIAVAVLLPFTLSK